MSNTKIATTHTSAAITIIVCNELGTKEGWPSFRIFF